jgi:alkanesulfonate monooxygenase
MNIKVFATCPQSKDMDNTRYVRAVADVARWSEAAGCAGILVYTDNGIVDPWLVSQVILAHTERLGPLVAIQPLYMHPYTAAKMVASLAFMHGRRVYLNMLAGGFKNDLAALGDHTPHDERYARTIEYTQIMMGLLAGGGPVTLDGTYYTVTNLRLTPAVPPDLVPEVLISGSSPAGLAAAAALGAIPVKYPKPPGEEEPLATGDSKEFGVRVGIIARESADEAWHAAYQRFPHDRKGQIAHKLAMSVSDSHWHRQLSQREHPSPDETKAGEPDPYWLGPFQNYKTFCPYLVGSYERVAAELARYIELGTTTFILDIPASQVELEHIGVVFELARSAAVGA